MSFLIKRDEGYYCPVCNTLVKQIRVSFSPNKFEHNCPNGYNEVQVDRSILKFTNEQFALAKLGTSFLFDIKTNKPLIVKNLVANSVEPFGNSTPFEG